MPQDFGAGESPLDQSIEQMFGDAPSVPEPLVEKAAKEDIIKREPDENETESRKRLVTEWGRQGQARAQILGADFRPDAA